MENPLSMESKNILVTGASSGIGRETAILISKLGGRVIITGRDSSRLGETLNLMESPERHIVEPFDLTEVSNISEWLSHTVMKHGLRLDGFVHCAGIYTMKPLSLLESSDLDGVMKINFLAGIELLRKCVNPRISNRGSSFIFIASTSGLIGEAASLAYCSSKAAVVNSVKSAALELAKYRHRVNCIAPGMVDTSLLRDYFESLDDSTLQDIKKKIPLGVGSPKDVANSAAFLLSDASKWITGTTLIVDGGYLCGK